MQQQATVVADLIATSRHHRVDRWFYVGMALLMILVNIVAFGPSIVDPSHRNAPLPFTPLVLVHAVVAAAWLFVFLAQATLVATRRTAVHRRLGVVGAALTVAVVVLGYFAVIGEARRGFSLSGDGGPTDRPGHDDPDRLPVTVAILFNLLMFAVLAGVGLWYRHRPSVHKRLMFLALGALLPTPVGHITGHWPVLQEWGAPLFPLTMLVFLSAGVIHDRLSQRRIHPISLWGMLLMTASIPLFFGVIVFSSAWRSFSMWLIR